MTFERERVIIESEGQVAMRQYKVGEWLYTCGGSSPRYLALSG